MYEAYFNLKERPFSISPDPRFFYLTAQHKEALTNCQYMITNRVGPVYVHGDVGTGKTTIARRLYQQLLDDPKGRQASQPKAPLRLREAQGYSRKNCVR